MWHITHQVHFPTLALGLLWIVHSAATTMYVPWQNQRQRAAIESVTTVMASALTLHDELAEFRLVLEDGVDTSRLVLLRKEIVRSADQLVRQMPDQPVQNLAREIQQQVALNESNNRQFALRESIDQLVSESQRLIQSQQERLLEVIDQRSRTDVVVMMRNVCKQIGRVAPQNVNVLILGESGTGKELVARAIFQHSSRNAGPFLAINCAAIPEMLLEAELFGHEKGAFTGAHQRRIGKFEQCDRGTLLLDEIGDMSPTTQAKLLRLLQEGCFERIGGNETIRSDVRIIAATNRNLETLIEQGTFRLDLLYRLRGVTIDLPPLRDRREGISELAHHFLFRYRGETGNRVQSISPEALEILSAYSWPGNVRELQNVIRGALIAATGASILPAFLPAEILNENEESEETAAAPVTDDWKSWQSIPTHLDRWLHDAETDIYRRALRRIRPIRHRPRSSPHRRKSSPRRRAVGPEPNHGPQQTACDDG